MLSKQKIKTIHSLELKKFRDQLGLFIGEGPKVIEELLKNYKCSYIAATRDWLQENHDKTIGIPEVDEVTKEELSKASLHKTPQKVIGIFVKKQTPRPLKELPKSELCIALDTIQDPGNLGTIIRLASWFGIKHVICTNTTVDAYSPKVVQATMGAVGKTNVYYCDLGDYLNQLDADVPVYGTFLEGEDIYDSPLTENGVVIMGNEGKGISNDIAKYVNHKLYIPPYPDKSNAIESLNVSIATAITCAEFRRRSK